MMMTIIPMVVLMIIICENVNYSRTLALASCFFSLFMINFSLISCSVSCCPCEAACLSLLTTMSVNNGLIDGPSESNILDV